jgi:hypothetical protein
MDGKHPEKRNLPTGIDNFLDNKRLKSMKIIALILTFLVLSNFVNGQDKMGFGNMPEGVDSAGIGTVTTWVKKTVPTGGQFVMKTSDTSSAFKFDPEQNFVIANSGATLHWEVTGAVTASYDGNYPTFDFSAPGEKIITITSADNLINLTELYLNELSITSLDVSNLINLTELYLNEVSITSLDVSNLVNLIYLELNNLSIASLDVSNLVNLIGLYLNNLSITSLDVSNLVNLTELYLRNLSITSLDLNNILDQLIAIGNNGSFVEVFTTCADASKIAALDAIWDYVYITPCN